MPFPSTDIRVVDPETGADVPLGEEGELWVSGPQRFMGYWKREDETAKTITPDGWLRTGDIVRLDEDFFIQIVDRIKEVIITGGFNVSLREHCYSKVTRYKVPRRIVVVDDLPRSMLGKVLRRKVREQLIASGDFEQ